TSLGDPIEAQALGAVLGEGRPADQPVMIGSVKSNIGHLESAAGIAGLIKAILVLQHRAVPPQVNLTELSPYIPWERLPLVIPIELTPFEPVSGRRLAGVSAFGFSGTNCHVILEEAPEIERINNSVDRTHHLLALSAKSAEALRQRALQITEFLSENEQVELADVAHTLNVGRAHFNHRLTVMAATPDEAGKRLQAFAEGREVPGISSGILETTDRPRIAFLFTGQGAQYVGMGRVLYDTQPTFRAALDACDAVLRSFLPQPLLSVIYPQEGQSSPIDHTTYTQPALFAIEYALAQLWQSWGIEPHAVLGHSVGEYVAACLAGVFSLEDGLRLIAERGRLMGALPAGGAMAAAFADEQTVGDIIRVFGDAVTIATINGPENTVISGSEAAVVEAMEALKAQGIKSRRLNVSHAFHSALMEPMLPEFEQVLANVALHRPRLRLAANVTGTFITDEVAHPDYWLRQARGAVRFADCVQSLYDAGYRVFLEIGPNPTLSAMAQRIVPGGNWLASLRQDKDDWATLLTTLGSLYTLGAGPDWAAFDRDYARRRISLPTYPFQRQRYWVKKKPQSARISAARTGVHPLLGERLRSPLKTVQFENVLTPTAFSFLNDHRIHNMPVLPGTAYMEMALAAAESVVGQGFVENMGIYEALVVPDDEQREVQFVLEPGSAGRYLFQLFSQQDGEWKLHASGEIVPGQPAPEPAEPVGARQSR
ncbi:MAG TPA: type I polyketide synthase, partial [Spirillospora sp.]|nr:type I polyketide synthase [Spirillospora sp.]